MARAVEVTSRWCTSSYTSLPLLVPSHSFPSCVVANTARCTLTCIVLLFLSLPLGPPCRRFACTSYPQVALHALGGPTKLGDACGLTAK